MPTRTTRHVFFVIIFLTKFPFQDLRALPATKARKAIPENRANQAKPESQDPEDRQENKDHPVHPDCLDDPETG